MSNQKCTPGPWEWEYDNDCIPDGYGGSYLVEFEILRGKDRQDILRADDRFYLSDEDARLIAAGPDLLEALQSYLAWADKTICLDAVLRAIRENARAAIAKATGCAETAPNNAKLRDALLAPDLSAELGAGG